MRFDRHHKVIISSLTPDEAPEVILFLQDEITRHEKCIEMADFMRSMCPIIGEIYASTIDRHSEDIEGSNIKIGKIKKRFNL